MLNSPNKHIFKILVFPMQVTWPAFDDRDLYTNLSGSLSYFNVGNIAFPFDVQDQLEFLLMELFICFKSCQYGVYVYRCSISVLAKFKTHFKSQVGSDDTVSL